MTLNYKPTLKTTMKPHDKQNKKMSNEITRIVREDMVMENSFGTTRKEKNVEVTYNVILPRDGYGSFEIFDNESGGENWYAEGGLWFKGNVLTDYDGVFELLPTIIAILEENGFDPNVSKEKAMGSIIDPR